MYELWKLERDSESSDFEPEDLKTLIYICTCGEDGCGSVLCNIKIDDSVVIWSGFSELLSWDEGQYEKQGPLVFDKRQYFDALTQVKQWIM